MGDVLDRVLTAFLLVGVIGGVLVAAGPGGRLTTTTAILRRTATYELLLLPAATTVGLLAFGAFGFVDAVAGSLLAGAIAAGITLAIGSIGYAFGGGKTSVARLDEGRRDRP